jgi:hypothetical protein
MLRMRVLALLAMFSLAACGAGGGQSAALPVAPAANVPVSGSTSTSATFTITVPAAAALASMQRTPAFVSPSTASVAITLTTVNGAAYTGSPRTIAGNLTTSNPNCSGSPLTCTVSAPAAAGTDVFTVTTYDQQQPSTSPTTPVGNVLSQATLSIAVTANQANTVTTALILNGAPSTFVIAGIPAGTIGTAFGSPRAIIVNAKDAGGNTIVGTYLHPVTLSNSDTSGATAIATSGSDNPPALTLVSSADVATLNYTGATLASATITAATSGATSTTGTFTPSAPALSVTSSSAASGLIGTTTTTTITGAGFTPASTVALSGSGATAQTTYVSATQLTAVIFTDPSAAGTARDVVVTNNATTATLPGAFTVVRTGVVIVTLATDSGAGTPPGSGAGTTGDLRKAILTAASGATIVFDTTAMGGSTITLAGPLPPIEQSATIDGGFYGRITIDGANLYRAFFIDSGTVVLRNLSVQNARAKGGNGGDNSNVSAGGGGGGFGAGACVFVNKASAAVTVANDYFAQCTALGGNGGNANQANDFRGGGGGGMGGDGAATGVVNFYGGGGGGGVIGAGSIADNNGGGRGGIGGGGGGAGQCSAGSDGIGGTAYGSNSAGSDASSAGAGNGGFGGGGGGTSNCSNFTAGGSGGFGGGGGGGEVGGAGGTAGTGGGGSGGSGGSFGANGAPGSGGLVAGGVAGGIGGSAGATTGGFFGTAGAPGGGGGGAAAGPAIFVNAGTLTIVNSGATGASATAGTGGIGGVGLGGSNSGSSGVAGMASATPVLNLGGTVTGALTTTTPAVKSRRL